MLRSSCKLKSRNDFSDNFTLIPEGSDITFSTWRFLVHFTLPQFREKVIHTKCNEILVKVPYYYPLTARLPFVSLVCIQKLTHKIIYKFNIFLKYLIYTLNISFKLDVIPPIL